jgi:hypothetical protein
MRGTEASCASVPGLTRRAPRFGHIAERLRAPETEFERGLRGSGQMLIEFTF